MEGAGIGGFVAALVAAERRAAVAAGIDEGVQLAAPAARNEDGLPAHIGSEVIVVVRDLALVRQVDPVALEDVLHLKLEHLGIGEDVAADAVDPRRGVILQCGVERLLD